MNARQLKVIAVVLGVAVLLYLPRLFRDSGAGGTLDVGDGFSFVVTDSIAGVDIVVADDAGTVRLERTDAGWTVDGYVADEPKIRGLLDVIGRLSSSELIARNPSNHANLGVAEGGRQVEVRTVGGDVRRFHLGERDTRSGGDFVRLPGGRRLPEPRPRRVAPAPDRLRGHRRRTRNPHAPRGPGGRAAPER